MLPDQGNPAVQRRSNRLCRPAAKSWLRLSGGEPCPVICAIAYNGILSAIHRAPHSPGGRTRPGPGPHQSPAPRWLEASSPGAGHLRPPPRSSPSQGTAAAASPASRNAAETLEQIEARVTRRHCVQQRAAHGRQRRDDLTRRHIIGQAIRWPSGSPRGQQSHGSAQRLPGRRPVARTGARALLRIIRRM